MGPTLKLCAVAPGRRIGTTADLNRLREEEEPIERLETKVSVKRTTAREGRSCVVVVATGLGSRIGPVKCRCYLP